MDVELENVAGYRIAEGGEGERWIRLQKSDEVGNIRTRGSFPRQER